MSHAAAKSLIGHLPKLLCVGPLLLCLSCTRYPKLEPHEPGFGRCSRSELDAPIILVGQLLSNQAVGRPYAPKWDIYIKIQEYRATVKVESILRGTVAKPEVPIYYFGYVSNVGGPPHLGTRESGGDWQLGDSVIFFLEPEQGALRTICDFRYYCAVQVFTGVHPNFTADPNKPLGCAIAELLLSRGPKTTDMQMARAILDNRPHVFSESCTMQRLKELEKDPSPLVREAAICVERAPFDYPCQMRLPAETTPTGK